MKKAVEVCSVEGNDQTFRLTITNKDTGAAEDITGHSFVMRVRYKKGDILSKAMVIVDAVSGIVEGELTPSENIQGRHLVEFVWTNLAGKITTIPKRAIEYWVRDEA